MKKRLLWLLLLPIIIWGISIVNASDTSCWSTYWWTPPTTTYASWIVYWCDENDIPIITIYWDDGKWITIKAMNEWATAIWAKNDSTGSYWNSYQRWNNHWFLFASWKNDINISTEYTSTKVDVTNYWPVNKSISWYYDSGTWIPQIQWSTDNRNLWGGSWDENWTNGKWWFYTDHFVAINVDDRQWMCDDEYHIPSQWEWVMLMQLRLDKYPRTETVKTKSRNYWLDDDFARNYIYDNDGDIWNHFSSDMMLPFVGSRSYNGTVDQGGYSYYWSSSPDNAARSFYLDPNSLDASYGNARGYGYAVRCFKNSYVKLPKTLNISFMSEDVEVWTWEVTENMTGAVPEEAKNLSKTWYVLEYRYLSGADATTWFDFENTPISWAWADESGNVYFIAQWTGIKYEIKFEAWDWTWTMENQTFIYDVAQNLTGNTFTRDWYTFSGWTDWTTWYTDGQEVINLTTTSGDVIILTAEWTKIETKPSWGYSGWGGRSRSSNTQDSSTSSQNDKKTENVIQSDPEHSEWGSEESSKTPMDSSTSSQNDGKSYTQEFQEAYEFAHEKWITTMPTIQEAQMNWKLTRIAMAKMLSQYAISVLWQKPANIVTPKFNDVTDKQNSDYDDWVTLAYQLWIMWQNMPNNKFRPNDEVTRAEFATALSRMLYHTSDWEYKSTDKYYTNHMKKLVQEKIITNDDAKMKELRWYVMIMLMRSAK